MFGIKLTPMASKAAVESLVDVAAVEGDVVRRKDGVYACLVEVEGEFFPLMSTEEQDARIEAYARVLNGIPETWILQVTLFVEPTDVTGYVRRMEEVARREEGTALASLAVAQAELARELAEDVLAESTVLTVTGRNAEEARARAEQLLAALQANGFKATICDADRIGEILSVSYGHPPVGLSSVMGGMNAVLLHEPSPRKERKAKGGEAKAGIRLSPEAEPVLSRNAVRLADVVSPSAVVEHPGHLELGGAYAATLVAVAYPDQVHNGWLERLLHFTHGRVRRRISWFFEPVPSSKALAEINRKLADLDANSRWAARRGLRPDIETELGLEDAEILRQEIGRGTQRVFDVTMLVTLMADSLEELREAVARLRQDAAGWALHLRETWLEEAPAFRSTVPLGMAYVRRVRPIPTVPVATTFPFTAGEIMHEGGDLWGENLSTGNAVIIDPRRYNPAHMLVVAQTGSGKSYVVKVLATQALFRPDEDVMILDPSPPIDYRRWTRLLGGTYARFGAGLPDRINPCEVLLPAEASRVDDDMRRPATAKVAFLTSLFELMAYPEGGMPAEERAMLERPLFAMYQEFGMTDDWESIVDRQSLSAQPRAKRSPTLRDALRHIEAVPELRSLAVKLRPYVEGTLDMFSGETNVDMGRRLVVFNVHGLVQGAQARHLQAVAYAMIAEFVRWRLTTSRRRVLVVVDEGHIMFQRADTARFVSQLYRMARKQGGRVALLTQGITDLLGDPETGVQVEGEAEARTCLTNTGVTILLRNDKTPDLRLIMGTYNLTETEARVIRSAGAGQGVVVAGRDKAIVQVRATEALHPYITTDPEEVEAFRAQGLFEGLEDDEFAEETA